MEPVQRKPGIKREYIYIIIIIALALAVYIINNKNSAEVAEIKDHTERLYGEINKLERAETINQQLIQDLNKQLVEGVKMIDSLKTKEHEIPTINISTIPEHKRNSAIRKLAKE